jgi:hypothetical protein
MVVLAQDELALQTCPVELRQAYEGQVCSHIWPCQGPVGVASPCLHLPLQLSQHLGHPGRCYPRLGGRLELR